LARNAGRRSGELISLGERFRDHLLVRSGAATEPGSHCRRALERAMVAPEVVPEDVHRDGGIEVALLLRVGVCEPRHAPDALPQ